MVGFFVGSLIRLGFSGSFWCEFAVNFLKQNGPFNFKGILGPIFCLFGQTGLVVGEGEGWCFFWDLFLIGNFLRFPSCFKGVRDRSRPTQPTNH